MAEDPGEIREEIEATRDALAGTIQALGEKADIKGRVADALHDGTRTAKDHVVASVSQVRSRLSNQTTDPMQPLIGSTRESLPDAARDQRVRVVAALVALLTVFVASRRWKRRHQARACVRTCPA